MTLTPHPQPAPPHHAWPRKAIVSAAATVLVGLVLTASSGAAPPATAFCGRGLTAQLGSVEAPELIEASGLAPSRRYPGVVWAHNDSGDRARVFALRRRGTDLGDVDLGDSARRGGPGAVANFDWEDMAIAPSRPGGRDRLYLGDIGDNFRARTTIEVYRTAEPVIENDKVVRTFPAQKLTLRYPDGAHDAETLLVDPRRRDLIIVTKEASGMSGVYVAPAPQLPGRVITLRRVGEMDLAVHSPNFGVPETAPVLPQIGGNLATGGDVSRDGSVVALRTYGGVVMFPRTTGEPLWKALTATGCIAPSGIERQGEAIAFDRSGRGFITISEGPKRVVNHTRVGA